MAEPGDQGAHDGAAAGRADASAARAAAKPEAFLVKSAERTVRILELLAASPTRLTISEIQERTGYPRSSLHALVRTLRDLRWLEADEAASSFTVGPHALLAGTSYLDRDPALSYVDQVLEDLRAEIGYTIHYARRDDAHVLYLATREARDDVRRIPRVGRRLPIHVTALGHAMLAELTADEVDDILPDRLESFTERTIVDRAMLRDELDSVRTRGWAFEREQGAEGIACVATAVAYRIPATDALSCSMPAELAVPDEVVRVSEVLVPHAQRLSAMLRRAGIR